VGGIGRGLGEGKGGWGSRGEGGWVVEEEEEYEEFG